MIKNAWLFIFTFLVTTVSTIYLPNEIKDSNCSKIDLTFDPGPMKVKLESPSKSTLALTSGTYISSF